MCPDRKLDWLKSAVLLSTAQVKRIREAVIKRWTTSYAPDNTHEEEEDTAVCVNLLFILKFSLRSYLEA